MKGQKAKQGAKGTENLLGKSKSQAQGKFKAEQLEIKKSTLRAVALLVLYLLGLQKNKAYLTGFTQETQCFKLTKRV